MIETLDILTTAIPLSDPEGELTEQSPVVQQINRLGQHLRDLDRRTLLGSPQSVPSPTNSLAQGSYRSSTQLTSAFDLDVVAAFQTAARDVFLEYDRRLLANVTSKFLIRYELEKFRAQERGELTRPFAFTATSVCKTGSQVNWQWAATKKAVEEWFFGTAAPVPAAGNSMFEKLARKLDVIASTTEWHEEAGPRPLADVIDAARMFLNVARQAGAMPSRIAPTVVGGIGVTFKRQYKKVYVEFRNTGSVHVLFSDGVTDPVVEKVIADVADYERLLKRANAYIHE